MVISHSRRANFGVTLGQNLKHFLAWHKKAWEYFEATARGFAVVNLKVAVLHHSNDGPVVFRPRYLDMAQHSDQSINAGTRRKSQQKVLKTLIPSPFPVHQWLFSLAMSLTNDESYPTAHCTNRSL
jgi:hypothetical protein